MTAEDTEPPVDAAWWRPLVTAYREGNDHQALFSLSRTFAEAASACVDGSLQRATLNALTLATVARLHPDRWNDPFTSLMPSDLPAGIDDVHFQILRRVAAAMDNSDDAQLHARVADLCWWYLDRHDASLRDAALAAYISTPLDPDAWYPDGRDAAQRAVEIMRRLRERGRPFIIALSATVGDRVRAATVEDRFSAVQLSGFARRERLLSVEAREGLAELAEALAAAAKDQKQRELEQAWETEAGGWHTLAKRHDEANAAEERRAISLASQAEDRRNGDGGSPNTASHFVERAIAALLALPRAYRIERGIDERVSDLRRQLDDDRSLILESMGVITSDPLDITEYVAHARERVTQLEPVDALIALGLIHQPANFERTVEQARQSLRDHPLLHLFGNEHYSETGQKVASSPGMTPSAGPCSPEDDPVTWSAMIRDHNVLVDLVVDALILPSLQTVNLQHRYSLQDLYEICTANPWIPRGHQATWAQGLLHGLNSDFASALAVLVPQLEHFVRVHLKQGGVYTLVTDDNGVENEKGLSRLLEEPAALDIFGATLLFELKATLSDKQGPNFRNTVAHGLVGDPAMVTRAPIYVWWFALNLVVRPHAEQRREQTDSPVEPDA